MHHRIRTYLAASAILLATHTAAAAQSYDPRTQSPMVLLTAPKDPIAYYDAKTQALALVAQNKAAEAEPLVERITREYPRDGENWVLLGQVKRMLNKYAESAAAYETAGKLLWWGGPASSTAAGATAHLLAGNKRAALDLLRRYTVEDGNMDRSWIFGDEDFVSLKADPEFLDIAGRPDSSGWSRDYGWRRDLEFLRDEVKRLNAEYRTALLPAEFESRYEILWNDVPRLSDEQIYVGINRLLADFRQGHTAVWSLSDTRVVYKGLPFQFWVFPEGVFIVHAAAQHKDLIGARLVSIEDTSAEEALRKVNETQSVDGDNEYLFMGVESLREAAYLVGLGIAKSTESIRITVQKPGLPKRTLAVETTPARSSDRLMPLSGVEAPLFLQEAKETHWHKALPEQTALYVQFNNVSNEKDETLKQYSLRLRALISESAPKNLILDMRHNDGGSTHLYAEFLRTMIGFSMLPERRLYVLTSRNTYSAAGNLITELEQLADATFVGEASSECCTFYASPSGFTLPFSKLKGRMSTKKWSLSRKGNDFRRELNPHVPIVMTAKDYFSGRDPVMETVARLIERNEAAKVGAPGAPATTK